MNRIKVLIAVLLSVFILAGGFSVVSYADNTDYLGFSPIDETRAAVYAKSKTGISGSVSIPLTCTVFGDQYEVTQVLENGFKGCADLTEVILPGSITEIGASAFENCGLNTLNIPAGIKKIGLNAFAGNKNLSSISAAPGNTEFIADGKALYSADGKEFVQFAVGNAGTYFVQSGTETIDSQAFAFSKLSCVVLPDSLKIIGDDAFKESTSLSTVNFPTGLEIIGQGAFYKCFALKTVSLPLTLKSFEQGFTFAGVEALTLADGIKEISQNSFKSCTGIKSVEIPDSVSVICSGAFSGCTKLETIKMGDKITEIGNEAFYNTAYYNNSGNRSNGALYYNNYLLALDPSYSGSFEVKNGTTLIADKAFYKCNSLTSVTIPGTVTAVNPYTFYDCQRLEAVKLPETIKSIGAYAFYNCLSLKGLYIPESVKQIDADAFKNSGNVVLYVVPGSYAERYAVNSGMVFSRDTLKVTSMPAKTSYNYKQSLDETGLKISVFDGKERVLNRNEYTLENTYFTKTGQNVVTVRYGNLKTQFTVDVSYSIWQWIIRILFLGFLWY